MRAAGWILAGLLWAGPALAALETLEQVDACVDANQPDESSVQTINMKAHDRIGSVTETRAKIYWRRFEKESKVLVRLNDPPEMRGAAILMLGGMDDNNDIFMYLPELDRVKRVTGHMMSGSVFGTDFSYEEFEGLMGVENSDFQRALTGTATVGERGVYLVESTPKEGLERKPNYEKVLTYVDQEWCLPLQVEFFERGDKLRKRLTTDVSTVEAIGRHHFGRRMEMTDLRDGTKTELEVEEVDLEASVSRSLFTQRNLEKMGGKSF